MAELASVAWPLALLPQALEALARHARLIRTPSTASPPAFPAKHDEDELERWLHHAGEFLGIEVEPVEAKGVEIESMLCRAGPALLRCVGADEPCVLLLLHANKRVASVLGPDLRTKHVPFAMVRAALCGVEESIVYDAVDDMLSQTDIAGRRRVKAQRLLVQQRMANRRFSGCWLLRLPPSASFAQQLVRARLPGRLLAMFIVFIALFAAEIAAWVLIGRGALQGRLDYGWLIAWTLLAVGATPLRLAGDWLQGRMAIDLGALLKQRLLAGALQMSFEDARQRGAGQWLSRVIESEALESLGLSGGFAVLIATLELCIAAWVLASGAGGGWHAVQLLAWLAATAVIALRYFRKLAGWTENRLSLTHDLIERMVGHRTRMVQKAPEHTHDEEDEALDRYLGQSKDMDGTFMPLAVGAPRGWIVFGMLGLAPAFIAGTAEAGALAVGVGGVLLAYRALSGFIGGLAPALRAAVAAKEAAPLFAAAGRRSERTARVFLSSEAEAETAGGERGTALIHARDLVFRRRDHGEPVLRQCDLTIHHGDRILLEGPSGGGKSTFASLLVGLRRAESGLLLLNGLDAATLGDAWRRLSTSAPQFQENHVLTGTLAFNLLMGRRWPPTDEDLATAEALCRELGLGALIDTMPSGLLQVVGETGWQLSHGECSRLYLARALLQQAQFVVLDESFAALDPETLDRCLRCALSRAPTLMVIAHP